MTLVRAPTPGSGKSLLVDVFATVATGRLMPVITVTGDSDETEKRLSALLLAGASLISLDNASINLGGDLLCAMLTSERVQVRILGRSEVPETECRAAVFATGNNISVIGDMTRRTLLCNLDPKVERPELVRYPFDPLLRALDNRGAYVAAAITIARAYQAAGSPAVCPNLNGYGPWSDLVRAPLIWLGEGDPAESIEQARAEDPVLTNIRELFAHWKEHLRGGMHTAREIIDVACAQEYQSGFTHPDFRDLLVRVAPEGQGVSSRKLGMWLTGISNRVVDGAYIAAKKDEKRGNQFMLAKAKS
jgi:putative DNA primase/helicase